MEILAPSPIAPPIHMRGRDRQGVVDKLLTCSLFEFHSAPGCRQSFQAVEDLSSADCAKDHAIIDTDRSEPRIHVCVDLRGLNLSTTFRRTTRGPRGSRRAMGSY